MSIPMNVESNFWGTMGLKHLRNDKGMFSGASALFLSSSLMKLPDPDIASVACRQAPSHFLLAEVNEVT